jgi:tetratricopeptide (TPR) repeat protein
MYINSKPLLPDTKASRRNRLIPIICIFLVTVIVVLIVYFTRSSENPDLRSAHEAIDVRDFERASEYLNKYLIAHPDDKSTCVLAAQTARRRGDYISALTLLTKCQQLNGSNEPVELEFRLLRLQQGKLADADALMASYANRPEAPETPFVLEAVAVGVLNRVAPTETAPNSLTDEAVSPLRHAQRASELWLELRPNRMDQVVGHLWLGRIRVLEGEQADGVAHLRKALEIDPDNFNVRFQLASVIAQAQPAEAASHLSILLNRNPTESQVAFRLATAYRGLGRLDEAERLLDQMLDTNPREISVLVERGLLAMDQSRLVEADRFLFRAFKLAPDVPEVNLALSQYMQMRGDSAKVKEYRDRFDRLEAARKK